MNKIIEDMSRALCRLRVNKDDYVDEQWPCFTHDAKAVLTTLAGKLDERASIAAAKKLHEWFGWGDDWESGKSLFIRESKEIVQAYLNQLINEEKE